jgi:hypothetical protein
MCTKVKLSYGKVALDIEEGDSSAMKKRSLSSAFQTEVSDSPMAEMSSMLLSHYYILYIVVEKTYNKHVGLKSFSKGNMVWKIILPIGHKNLKFSKWSLK